jgi:soluble lytic murein transglycosylase
MARTGKFSMEAAPMQDTAARGWLTPLWAAFMMARMSSPVRVLSSAAAFLIAATIACSAPGALAVGPTPTPSLTPTATITPSPTPTPTPEPSTRLDQADRARFVGDWDTAIQDYQTVLGAGVSPEIAARAELGLGLVLVEAERYDQAITALTDYINIYPGDSQLGQAFFLRAEARQANDDAAGAIGDYRQYLNLRPGRIDSLVPHLSGDVGLQVKIGRAYLEAGNLTQALSQFDEVYRFAPDDSTRASANLLAGQVLETMGDSQSAYTRYMDSVDNFPTAYDSYVGLVRLVNAGVPVDDFQRGLVDFNAAAYEPALAALGSALLTEPSGKAFYFQGLARRAQGDAQGAVQDFDTVIQRYQDDPNYEDAWMDKAFTQWAYLDQYTVAVQTYLDFAADRPQSNQAPQAIFNAGRTAERNKDLRRAAEIWLGLPQSYPESSLAYQGAFEASIVLYRAGDFTAAQSALGRAGDLAGDTGQRAAVQLWMGKAYQALGDGEQAKAAWMQAAAIDPTGYYSERAADLLAGRGPFQPLGLFNFTTDLANEKAEAEAWMRTTFNMDPSVSLDQLSQTLATDPRMIRGRELWALGQTGPAKDEFESLRHDVEQDPASTYQLMQALLDIGLYQPAIFAARQVLNLAGMDDAATMKAPVYFNHVRFGPYFGDIILPEAVRQGFDGLFLLSVVRQESLFEGFITSYAAARGLMQVIPPTGQSIADQLGWPPGYTSDDLYRPLVSVRFGTYYLAQQRDRFDGDLYAALAAYNAGPGNAALWKDLAPDDPDLFLEVIRLDQTHRYLTTIYEVFDIYRNLYVQSESN